MVFFVKQKTAYEWRISDWSSDVCSSDLFGIENERSRFRSVSPPASLSTPVPPFARGSAEITSVYGQLRVEPLSGLTLTGGVRNDDHSRFGGETLFSAGGIWVLPTNTALRASYGEGFKAPTLYQLFSERSEETTSELQSLMRIS